MLELFRFPEPPRTTIGILLPGYHQVRPALIDTGADRCVLTYEEGKQLNLPQKITAHEPEAELLSPVRSSAVYVSKPPELDNDVAVINRCLRRLRLEHKILEALLRLCLENNHDNTQFKNITPNNQHHRFF